MESLHRREEIGFGEGPAGDVFGHVIDRRSQAVFGLFE